MQGAVTCYLDARVTAEQATSRGSPGRRAATAQITGKRGRDPGRAKSRDIPADPDRDSMIAKD
jgi:hypothetical protein